MSAGAQRNDCYHSPREASEITDKLGSRDLAVGVIFLSQTIVGVLGNFSLLCHHLCLRHAESRARSTHLILRHLCVANSLVILSRGLPHTMEAFGLRHTFSDFTCKFLLYIDRVGRGVSIFTVCILSVFQNITISPMNSRWKDLKVKPPKYIGVSICLCWVLQMLVNLILPLYVSGEKYNRNITRKTYMGFCSAQGRGAVLGSMYIAFVVFPEVCFSALMVWASGSMIVILHRHKQRVQHIHTAKFPSRSPESRATHSILLLVSTFVSFYTVSSIFHSSIALLYNLSWWLVSTSRLISVCFPTISPFLVMSQDSSILRYCFGWIRKTNLCILIKNI